MKPHRVNTVVTIFCEGDTEEEFHPKLVQYIRKQRGGVLDCRIETKNLKEIQKDVRDLLKVLI